MFLGGGGGTELWNSTRNSPEYFAKFITRFYAAIFMHIFTKANMTPVANIGVRAARVQTGVP